MKNQQWRTILWEVLREWVEVFYDCDDGEKRAQVFSLLLKKDAVKKLFDLKQMPNKKIEVDLGYRKIWNQGQKKLLFLTMEGGIFGVWNPGESGLAECERNLESYATVNFLLAVKSLGLMVQEDHLVQKSVESFFLMDTDYQYQCGIALPEIRKKPEKVVSYRRNTIGPALIHFRRHLTSEALQLATLCFEARQEEEKTRYPIQEAYSFKVLNKVYDLEKLVNEGRPFWDEWKRLLSVHIELVLAGIISYAPKSKIIPLSAQEWFDLLIPRKKQFQNFLFFLPETEGAKSKALDLIGYELSRFVKDRKYVGDDGLILKKPELPAYDYYGMKSGLRSLARAVF